MTAATTPSPAHPPLPGIARLSHDGGEPFLALVRDGAVHPLSGLLDARGRPVADTGPWRLLDGWEHNAPLLRGLRPASAGRPLAGHTVHAPIVPRNVYCTIGNYRRQVVQAAVDAIAPDRPEEREARRQAVLEGLAQRQREGEPYAVAKPASTVAAPFGTLAVAPDQQTLDWEVEIGVVIGRAARHVSAAQAPTHVAGYCTVNDITLRQRMFRTDVAAMGTDFLQAKGGPGWLPVGPWLVPAWEVPHPESLRLRLWLNGEAMQDDGADDMVFDIPTQIAYLSRHVELQPGDLLCTGSPAGFGQHHGRYLRPGDRLEAEVSGLGRQRIDIVT